MIPQRPHSLLHLRKTASIAQTDSEIHVKSEPVVKMISTLKIIRHRLDESPARHSTWNTKRALQIITMH